MTAEDIKKVLEEFLDEEGQFDIDKASETLAESLEGSFSETELTLEKIAKMTPDQVNKNWKEIQTVLRGATGEC
ncbi:hypothetical protein [Enterococcus sp. DIV1420a]|uniref:hypothetical protein n=1 Tax=Enterococcus sp. DIV1420a TaxID=2774672 RepID=UPI003F266247